MSSITDKLWGIYKESKDTGLNVSLTVSICNGAETFVFKSVPSNCVTDISNHGRRNHGRRRGRRGGRAQQAARSAGAAQLAAAAPSYATNACTLKSAPTAPSYAAVARSPPSLLQSRTVKRAKRPSGALACAAADAVIPVAAVSSAESPVDDIRTAPRAATSNVSSVVVDIPAAVKSASAADAGEAVTAADVVHSICPLPPPPSMQLRRRSTSISLIPPNTPTTQSFSSPTSFSCSSPKSPLGGHQVDGHFSPSSLCTSPTIPNPPSSPTPLPDFDYNDDDKIMFNTHVCKVPNCNDCNYFLSRDSSNWPTHFENLHRCSNWVVRKDEECPAHFHKWTHRCFDLGLFKSPKYKS